jgi:hypothetical protein
VSYLRGLLAKARVGEPRILPRQAPGIDSGPLEEIVEEEITAPRRGTVAPAPAGGAPADGPRGAPPSAPAPVAEAVTPPLLPAAAPVQIGPEARAAPPPPEPPLRRTRRLARRSVGMTVAPAFPTSPAEEAPPMADDGARPEAAPAPTRLVRARPPLPAARTAFAPLPPPARRPAEDTREPAVPDVHISIGRIDIRAETVAPAKPQRAAPFRPRLTLEDHLAGRSRERR